MPHLSPVILALSWGLMSSLQTLHGAVFPVGEAPLSDLPSPHRGVPHGVRTAGGFLGLGDFDFPVSAASFTLDLLATQSTHWPEAPVAADKEPSAPRKQSPAPMSIAMWFGVLGATLLILPRLRRR